MGKLNMDGYKVSEVSFVNHIAGGTKIQLENKYSFNVKYGNSNNCEGVFKVEVIDKDNPDSFSIVVAVNGLFTFEQGMEKEEIHVSAYNIMFPYARSLVTMLTATAGIPPIIIPSVDIEGQNIMRVDKNELEKQKGAAPEIDIEDIENFGKHFNNKDDED